MKLPRHSTDTAIPHEATLRLRRAGSNITQYSPSSAPCQPGAAPGTLFHESRGQDTRLQSPLPCLRCIPRVHPTCRAYADRMDGVCRFYLGAGAGARPDGVRPGAVRRCGAGIRVVDRLGLGRDAHLDAGDADGSEAFSASLGSLRRSKVPFAVSSRSSCTTHPSCCWPSRWPPWPSRCPIRFSLRPRK